jgi:hypothetical protein
MTFVGTVATSVILRPLTGIQFLERQCQLIGQVVSFIVFEAWMERSSLEKSPSQTEQREWDEANDSATAATLHGLCSWGDSEDVAGSLELTITQVYCATRMLI